MLFPIPSVFTVYFNHFSFGTHRYSYHQKKKKWKRILKFFLTFFTNDVTFSLKCVEKTNSSIFSKLDGKKSFILCEKCSYFFIIMLEFCRKYFWWEKNTELRKALRKEFFVVLSGFIFDKRKQNWSFNAFINSFFFFFFSSVFILNYLNQATLNFN